MVLFNYLGEILVLCTMVVFVYDILQSIVRYIKGGFFYE